MAKDILCAFGVDVDAVAGWLGSYGGEDSPDDISRGLFAGEVGAPRLLKLFERYGLRTTWFIPGHSMETFPEQMKAVADAGHEIGVHGYSHENPIAMTAEQEEIVLDKSIELITQVTGKRPTGYVAPWWEFSKVTNELLLKKGIKYDHSLMHNDFPRHLEEMWRDQFDWVYREHEHAVFTMTIHPDVSGRPQVLLMLERLIEHIQSHAGVRFVTFDEIADDFIRRQPRT